MGQYYRAVILNDNKKSVKASACSWDFDNGSKLMEHSYVGNSYVDAIASLMERGVGKYAGCPIVWAGDYADEDKGRKNNIHDISRQRGEHITRKDTGSANDLIYLINEDKKLYVNLNHLPSKDGYRVHPLPLLCCEGNGRGGGDYCPKDISKEESALIGSWARDRISFSKERPKGFKKLLKVPFKIYF